MEPLTDKELIKAIKCKFIKCFAGEGVAGMGYCFLGGDFTDPNCKNFKDETEAQLEHAEKYISEITEERDYWKRLAEAAGEVLVIARERKILGYVENCDCPVCNAFRKYESILKEQEK